MQILKASSDRIQEISYFFNGGASQVFDSLDCSDATRQDYQKRIVYFLDYVQDSGLNRDTFLLFKRHLANRVDISVSHKNKILAVARIFLKELNRRGVLPVDITQNVKGFQQSKKHRKDGLNDAEVEKLIKDLQSYPKTEKALRLKAILSLLLLQGLRQAEVIRLDVNNLDLKNGKAFVLGKGKEDREVIYLHPETVNILKEYLEITGIKDGALFQSRSNNSKNKRLSTRSLRKFVTDTFKELGIEKSTHATRHYFTTKLIKSFSGDLLTVAKFTRHKSLEMLQVYFDDVKMENDLPKYFEAFDKVKF